MICVIYAIYTQVWWYKQFLLCVCQNDLTFNYRILIPSLVRSIIEFYEDFMFAPGRVVPPSHGILKVMFDGLCYRCEWFSSFAKYRMFFAALISLSCLVLHTGHSHWRILSDHGFMWYWSWLLYMYPQQEHLLLDGLHFPIAITVRPCHADLYWMVVRSVPNAASFNAKLNRLFFSIPEIFNVSTAMTELSATICLLIIWFHKSRFRAILRFNLACCSRAFWYLREGAIGFGGFWPSIGCSSKAFRSNRFDFLAFRNTSFDGPQRRESFRLSSFWWRFSCFLYLWFVYLTPSERIAISLMPTSTPTSLSVRFGNGFKHSLILKNHNHHYTPHLSWC